MEGPTKSLRDSLGLPELKTRLDLVKNLGIPAQALAEMITSPDYNQVNIPKRDGSSRRISIPSDDQKAVQGWILRSILDPIAIDPAATGFRPGYSLLNNVAPHLYQPFVYTADIVNFFGHISLVRVTTVFRSIGYPVNIAGDLARLCCYDGCLPQGAVTSPALSNLACTSMDREIRQYAIKMNVMYTRYADDITLSARSPQALFRTVRFVRYVVQRQGFRMHPDKTKVIMPGDRHKITGLIINDKNEITIGRARYRRLRSAIYRLKRRRALPDFEHGRKSVLGWLCYLRAVDPKSAQRLEAYWTKTFGEPPEYNFD